VHLALAATVSVYVLGLFEAGHWPVFSESQHGILSAKERRSGNGLLKRCVARAIITPQYVMFPPNRAAGLETVF